MDSMKVALPPHETCTNCAQAWMHVGNRDATIRDLQTELGQLRPRAREADAAHAELDRLGVPATAPSGNRYTLAGRIRQLSHGGSPG